MTSMKAFVINLKRVPDRREYMYNQLKALGIDFEFIEAVDHQNIPDNNLGSLCNLDVVSSNSFFTKGVLACALSHLEAYKKVVQNNLQVALILEDDVDLGRNLKPLLELIKSKISGNEVISLNYFSHSGHVSFLSNSDKEKLVDGYSLVYPVDIEQVGCAMAYVITNEVAKKMLETVFPISMPADYWGGFFKKNVFTSFRCVYPPLVGVAPFRTTIDYAGSKSFISRIASTIRKYKIPFLHDFLLKRDKKLLNQKTFIFNNDLPFIYKIDK